MEGLFSHPPSPPLPSPLSIGVGVFYDAWWRCWGRSLRIIYLFPLHRSFWNMNGIPFSIHRHRSSHRMGGVKRRWPPPPPIRFVEPWGDSGTQRWKSEAGPTETPWSDHWMPPVSVCTVTAWTGPPPPPPARLCVQKSRRFSDGSRRPWCTEDRFTYFLFQIVCLAAALTCSRACVRACCSCRAVM